MEFGIEAALATLGHALAAERPEPPYRRLRLAVTIVAACTAPLRDRLFVWPGVRGLCAGTPSKNKIGIPRSSVAARPADRAVPPPIFFLLPLTRSRRRAGVHARTLRRIPDERRDHETIHGRTRAALARTRPGECRTRGERGLGFSRAFAVPLVRPLRGFANSPPHHAAARR